MLRTVCERMYIHLVNLCGVGLKLQGLFRLSGSSATISKLKDDFDRGIVIAYVLRLCALANDKHRAQH